MPGRMQTDMQPDMLSLGWPDPWIDGSIPPHPGQRVLHYYFDDDGHVAGPILGTPVHADGSHLRDSKPIYRPMACWAACPELPAYFLEYRAVTMSGQNAA